MARKLKIYFLSVLIAVGTGTLAGLLTKRSAAAFQFLAKPPLTPPAAVFPIVWTLLYLFMGIGAALVFRSDLPGRKSALLLYAVQLAVNFFWTILFFNLRAYWLSFFWLLLLLGLVIATIVSFARVSRSATLLQIPYLIWVAFAGYLNCMIALMNR